MGAGGTNGQALIAMGSNLGDSVAQLRSARAELERLGELSAASSIYRTEPVGGPPGQREYLNAVVALRPAPAYADPRSLLSGLLAIERRHGRRRRVLWEARTLDLDLLALGDATSEGPVLTLPHPRMMERAFVLAPLCEALPDWRHPLSGEGACAALERLGTVGVERTELEWSA